MSQDSDYKEFFKKKKITTVIFDMDNTLIDTNSYYVQAVMSAGNIVANTINKYSIDHVDESLVSERIKDLVFEKYNKDFKPVLIDSRFFKATEILLKEQKQTKYKKKVIGSIDTFFDTFYKESPKVFPATVRILNLLNSVPNVRLAVYSHAQKDWTKIKIENIQTLIENKYGYKVEIPFVTTPIDDTKDSKGWIKAAKKADSTLESSLVIGDNWNSDILAAIYAGCKNLIWINKKGTLTEERKDEIQFIKKKAKANVYVVRNISSVKKVVENF